MPGRPKPVIDPRFGSHWTPVIQAIEHGQDQQIQTTAGRHEGVILDQYGNVVELSSSNLNQVVTIGAEWLTMSLGSYQPGLVAGVLVGTGLTGAGRATQKNLAIGLISVTEGSTAATLVTTQSGAFANGMVIGAADVSDPGSGVATPAIPPIGASGSATTMTISGSAITLSNPAAESGNSIYCAACNFVPS